jgi:hypothetical protein
MAGIGLASCCDRIATPLGLKKPTRRRFAALFTAIFRRITRRFFRPTKKKSQTGRNLV